MYNVNEETANVLFKYGANVSRQGTPRSNGGNCQIRFALCLQQRIECTRQHFAGPRLKQREAEP